jgi:hypothetical protein
MTLGSLTSPAEMSAGSPGISATSNEAAMVTSTKEMIACQTLLATIAVIVS